MLDFRINGIYIIDDIKLFCILGIVLLIGYVLFVGILVEIVVVVEFFFVYLVECFVYNFIIFVLS